MRTPQNIITLAEEKLETAEFLINGNYFDDAYYIAGYALELYLKARICKTLDIFDLFDFDKNKNRSLPLPQGAKTSVGDNLYKPFKVHDYNQLFILSGLFTEFENKLKTDIGLKSDWFIVSLWNEDLRYSIEKKSKKESEDFLNSIKKIILWLKQYLSTI